MNKLALSLIGWMLAGCAHSAADEPPTQGLAVTAQLPIRVIIRIAQLPSLDDKRLAAAISDACRCQAVFLRRYDGNAVIYEINLPQSLTFASFERALLASGKSLGIQTVEQDALMRPQ